MDDVSESQAEGREFAALQAVIRAVTPMSPEARTRIIEAASTFLKINIGHERGQPAASRPTFESNGSVGPDKHFSEDRSMTPKEFLHEKQPRSGVERIACLAYYLTQYRSIPHFKTVDLSALNTEAAQPKFSNAAMAVSDATKQGFLVPAIKGSKQVSAAGERYVIALPDREAARQAMTNLRPKRKVRRTPRAGRPTTVQNV